ncbi:RHS domain-containing protein [Methylomagnum sp.]
MPADGPERIFESGIGRCRLRRWQQEGHGIALIYDDQGQVQALQASWGKTLLIQREGSRIAAIGPARLGGTGLEFTAPPWVRYQYDGQGDLSAALNCLGQGERYAYRNHVIVRRTLPSGFNFHFEWDSYTPVGRCVRNWGDGGIYDYRFEWTDRGISRAIDSRGGVTEYMHDAEALLLWETSPEGRTTRYEYNENNLPSSVTDPAGHATRYEYDAEGRLSAVIDPLGQVHRLGYDAAHKPTALTDPIGQTWTRAYDEQGHLTQAQDPQGTITRFSYNPQGLPAVITNALGQTRTLLWDEQARLVGEVDFNGVRQRYQYDGEDRIIAAITQDKLVSQYQYDAVGRIIAVKASDGAGVKLRYNPAGHPTHYTDAAGRTTEYRYGDGLSQITERIDPAGQILRYHYDSERNLIGLTNAKGENYRLNYDKDENLIEEIGFDGRIQHYRYDAAGNLETYAQRGEPRQGQPDWLITLFQRDPLGRLLKKSGPDGAVSEFNYDALGRLQQANNAHARLSFGYNPAGQIIDEIQDGAVATHSYDALGRRIATATPDGQYIEYAYDPRGRLQHVALDDDILSRHRFDELGLETHRQQGDLVSHYDYDPMGRLKLHQAGLAGNKSAVLGRRYGYGATGRLNVVDDFRLGQTHYIYDPADRLIQVEGFTPERFIHDPAGNLIGINQDSVGLVEGDRLLMLGDRHFAYDAAGNLIEERRGREGRLVHRYAYDGENRLVRAETPGGVATYRYDALGRRIAKETAQGETRFIYDGARLLGELQGGRRRLYLFEPGGFRPLACVDYAEDTGRRAVYYYHLDHLGTPREMTDARGHIVWSGRYRAYGSLALADVAAVDNPIRLQGQYYDAETGLHYNLNRYYDPAAGRFIRYVPNAIKWYFS